MPPASGGMEVYMKKAGTISSAAGLIFLGVWMIINKSSPSLANEMFKWWPAIFIILGLEILFTYGKNGERKPGINFIIIPVIIIFLIVNAAQSVIYSIGGKDLFNFDNFIKFTEDNDFSRYKEIKSVKQFMPEGSKIYFSSDNAKLKIIKSTDGKIKVDAVIYVDKSSSHTSYDINGEKTSDGLKINMNENYIKKVSVSLYIPDNYDLNVDVDNLDISNSNTLNAVDLKSDNGNFKMSNAGSIIINCDNNNANINDIKNISIKGNNSSVNINGNCENISINSDNGKAEINNKICRNVNVKMDNGVVKIKTADRNVKVDARLDQGTCSVFNDRRVNSGITKTAGLGEGIVNVKVEHGTISVSQE